MKDQCNSIKFSSLIYNIQLNHKKRDIENLLMKEIKL